jgi:hypothetical protein
MSTFAGASTSASAPLSKAQAVAQDQRSATAAADVAAINDASVAPLAASAVAASAAALAAVSAAQLRGPTFAFHRYQFEIVPTAASRLVVDAVGGFERIERVTLRFYRKFERDQYLRQFLGRLQVPLECHAARLAKYIVEQLTGEPIWTQDTRTRARTPVVLAGGERVVVTSRAGAHHCAWNSVDRPAHLAGRRFKLDDCRTWMRLLFWAAREEGFAPVPGHRRLAHACAVPSIARGEATSVEDVAFMLLQNFVAHFIAIYEETARPFTRHEALWSADPANLERYAADGHVMTDVLRVPYETAIAQVHAADLVRDAHLHETTVG